MLAAKRCTRVLPIAVPAALVCTDEHSTTQWATIYGSPGESAAACGMSLQLWLHWPCCTSQATTMSISNLDESASSMWRSVRFGCRSKQPDKELARLSVSAQISRLTTFTSRAATEQRY